VCVIIRDEATVGWRRVCNKEINNFCHKTIYLAKCKTTIYIYVCICIYDLTATFSVFSYQENTCTEHEISTLLGYYVAYNCNSLLRFWDNLSAQGPIGCPKTLARNYHYMLHNNPEECDLIYFVAEA